MSNAIAFQPRSTPAVNLKTQYEAATTKVAQIQAALKQPGMTEEARLHTERHLKTHLADRARLEAQLREAGTRDEELMRLSKGGLQAGVQGNRVQPPSRAQLHYIACSANYTPRYSAAAAPSANPGQQVDTTAQLKVAPTGVSVQAGMESDIASLTNAMPTFRPEFSPGISGELLQVGTIGLAFAFKGMATFFMQRVLRGYVPMIG